MSTGAGLLLAAATAFGQEQDDCDDLLLEHTASLATVTKAKVQVNDQISGGCWPRPTAAQTTVELAMVNNGIKLEEADAFFADSVVIAGVGYQTSEHSCAAFVSLSLHKLLFANLPYSHLEGGGGSVQNVRQFQVWTEGFILTGPRSDFQKRIKDSFEESIESLLLDLKKARASVFEKCPRMRDRILGANEE